MTVLNLILFIFAIFYLIHGASPLHNLVNNKGCEITNRTEMTMVSLRTINSWHVCYGTILTTIFILTAANCFEKSEKIYVHHIGTSYEIKRVHVHPKYAGRPTLYNDIAIIELEKAIYNITDEIVFKLPKEGCESDIDKCITLPYVIGADSRRRRENMMEYMQCMALYQLGIKECEAELRIASLYEAKEPLSLVTCVKNIQPSAGDICRQDRGGPFICDDVQLGIASFGYTESCDYQNNPMVYTKISCYLKFIYQTVQASGDKEFFKRDDVIDINKLTDRHYPTAGKYGKDVKIMYFTTTEATSCQTSLHSIIFVSFISTIHLNL